MYHLQVIAIYVASIVCQSKNKADRRNAFAKKFNTFSGINQFNGYKKIRLTGGEPLLYPNIEDLIIRFKAIQGIEKIVLTTNGILLSNKVDVLKKLV